MTARQRIDVRQVLAARMSERELDESVRDLCKWLGVRCYSVRNSKAGIVSSKGFPDLTLVGAGGICFRELKKENGELRPEQIEWGEALTAAGQDWKTWRPSDLIARVIEAELRQLVATTGRKTP
jgi:hypothetical protein